MITVSLSNNDKTCDECTPIQAQGMWYYLLEDFISFSTKDIRRYCRKEDSHGILCRRRTDAAEDVHTGIGREVRGGKKSHSEDRSGKGQPQPGGHVQAGRGFRL